MFVNNNVLDDCLIDLTYFYCFFKPSDFCCIFFYNARLTVYTYGSCLLYSLRVLHVFFVTIV